MRAASLLALLVLGLAVAGCLGGDDGSGVSTDGAPSASPPTTTEEGNRTGDGRDSGGGNGTAGEDGDETMGAGGSGNDTREADGPEDPADPGWPPLEEATIRPGVTFPSCTTSFLFRSPDNRTLYLGTAAHCVDDRRMDEQVELAGGTATAYLAYSSWRVSGDGAFEGENWYNDFALLRIAPADRGKVHPAVHHWGGPTGVADPPGAGEIVRTYGDSSFREAPGLDRLDPREGVVVSSTENQTRAYLGGIPGDSGSPVLTTEGAAVGVVSTLNRAWADHLRDHPPPGSNSVSNLGYALDYLHEHTDLQVELVPWEPLSSATVPDDP